MATTRKQRNVMNIAMVVLAAIIVIAGVVFVLSIRGGSTQESPFSVIQKTGYANIERAGISYTLDEGTVLQDGDTIETLNGSELTVAVEGGSRVFLADASQLGAHIKSSEKAAEEGADSLELVGGSLFADFRDERLLVARPEIVPGFLAVQVHARDHVWCNQVVVAEPHELDPVETVHEGA